MRALMFYVIYFFKRLILDIFKGIYFLAIDFDDRLKITKTLGERLVIWFLILSIASILISFLVFIFWRYLDMIKLNTI
jgi:hypothetical protein